MPTSSLDTPQLSLLSGMDMPAKSLENEYQTDGSPVCECGKGTLDCLIHPSTPGKWTAFMQVSLAKTLALLESRQAYLREPDQVFTEKSCGSLAWYDQSSSSWKTYQQSLVTDWEPYSETWPRWGMTQGGFAYAHPMSERRITETDGSYWPTPNAAPLTNNLDLQCSGDGRTKPNKLGWAVATQMFPTPTTIDAGTGRFNTSVGSSNHRPTLAMMAKKDMWPTPTARDGKGLSANRVPSHPRHKHHLDSITELETGVIIGRLNPTWVEWLMGFPTGFTVLKDWVTPKYRSKQQQPTDSLGGSDAP